MWKRKGRATRKDRKIEMDVSQNTFSSVDFNTAENTLPEELKRKLALKSTM